MRWISMIFLILCSFAMADVACIVGGSSSAATNAGWYDPDQVDASDVDGGNGAALASGQGVVEDAAGNVAIRDTDAFGLAVAGQFIYGNFLSDTHTDGRYIIQAVENDDAIRLEIAYISGTEGVDWTLGGAVPIVDATFELQDVLDDTTIGDAAAQNVDIYVAGSGTLTATIDVDTGGGSATTLKSIIGVNSSYVDDGTQVTLTAQAAAGLTNGIIEYDSGAPYINTKNIIFDANGDGAAHCVLQDDTIEGVVGCSFENCRFTDADDTGIRWGGNSVLQNLLIINCEIDLADSHGIESTHAVRGRFSLINTKIHDNGGYGAYFGRPGCEALGCTINDNGSDGLNIGGAAIGGLSIIGNTITRNDGDGLDFHADAHGAVIYNNVIVYNGGYSYKFNGSIPWYFSYNLGSTQGAETAITDAVADGAFAALFTGNNLASTQTEDALFVTVTDGSEDFTPETGSDLIDAGIDVQDTPTIDIGVIQLDAGVVVGTFPRWIERHGD